MKNLLMLLATTTLSVATWAQEETPLSLPEKNALKIDRLELEMGRAGNLKFSGYVQGQWQWAQSSGIAAFGDGGSFNATTNNRFMVRRGRVKVSYSVAGIFSAVIQPDFTEKGVSMKDAYLSVSTRNKAVGGQIGLFDRPFGYEISYSSSLRESPERSRVFLSLFPGERDLGVMLNLTGGKGWLSNFTLNVGLFNGNGIGTETDSQKDFIGRLAYLKKFSSAQVGGAFSYYRGGIINPQEKNFKYLTNQGFIEQTVSKGQASPRQYFGIAGQYIQQWGAGTTNIRAEYLWGQQTGTLKANNNPGGTSFGAGSDPLYLRDFRGAYAILVQDIGHSKHSIVLKYDYYDPNTKIKGDQIGALPGTGAADIAYSTFGVGYLFRWNQYIRLMAYYDMVSNERSANLDGYQGRIKQNVLTARVQFKF
ncbi:MAG: hypothetical protein RR329_04370 [Mucinivorans sp.]